MLIHFYGIVLTNCAMCLMLNIIPYFIYRYKHVVIIKSNVFIVAFDKRTIRIIYLFFFIIKLNYGLSIIIRKSFKNGILEIIVKHLIRYAAYLPWYQNKGSPS